MKNVIPKDYQIQCLPDRIPPEKTFSQVIPIEPNGLGTGQIECLSNYLLRLAEIHFLMTGSMISKVLSPLMPKRPGYKMNIHSCHFYMANGYGTYSQRMAAAITQATGGVNGSTLTFLPWRGVFDGKAHGLLKRHAEWCDECWNEDIEINRSPYVHLSWVCTPVNICIKHQRRLSSFCSHCGNLQRMVPVLPRIWICGSCGESLIAKKLPVNPLTRRQHERDFWIVASVERLIERTCAIERSLSPDCVAKALRELINTHAAGSYQRFGKLLQFDPKAIWRWAHDGKKPNFTILMDLCYRLDIPPDRLLLDGPALTDPKYWRKGGLKRFVSMRKLSHSDKSKIESALNKLVQKNPDPPPLPSDFASKLGITFNVLRYHYPEEYKILQQRVVHHRKALRTLEGKKRISHLTKSVEKLIDKGIYPSERQLKQFNYVRAGDLRRPEIIEKLRELQEHCTGMPIEIRSISHKCGRNVIEIRRPVKHPERSSMLKKNPRSVPFSRHRSNVARAKSVTGKRKSRR